MAAKMTDVARKANVSVATVSMILKDEQNGYKFSSETVENVKRIADDLGYRRNKLALSLRHQKNHQVGILSGGYRMDTWGQMLEGIYRRAARIRAGNFRTQLKREIKKTF